MAESFFPTELYERIIDYVGQAVDTEMLRACALVSRSWYPRARSHLVRQVVLVDRQQALGFARMVRSGRGPMGLADVGQMVEKLMVRGVEAGEATRQTTSMAKSGGNATTRRSLAHLGTCAAMLAGRARLDHLTYLGITRGDWRGLHPKIGDHLHAAFPRLRWLDLHDVQFVSTADFGRFLSVFTALLQLGVWMPAHARGTEEDARRAQFDAAAFTDRRKHMCLKRLTLNGSQSTKDVGEYLLATGLVQQLIEMRIGYYEQVPLAEVAPLILAATSLLGLDISLGRVGPDNHAGGVLADIPLDLTPNTQLQFLLLRMQLSEYEWLPAFLDRVSAKTIQGITIVFDIRRPSLDDTTSVIDRLRQSLNQQLCAAVDGVLSSVEDAQPHSSSGGESAAKPVPQRYRYARFRILQLALWVRADTVGSAFDVEGWAGLLQERFPMLHARRMLRTPVTLEDSTDFLHEK